VGHFRRLVNAGRRGISERISCKRFLLQEDGTFAGIFFFFFFFLWKHIPVFIQCIQRDVDVQSSHQHFGEVA